MALFPDGTAHHEWRSPQLTPLRRLRQVYRGALPAAADPAALHKADDGSRVVIDAVTEAINGLPGGHSLGGVCTLRAHSERQARP